MTTSDIITLVSMIIAIVAIINEKNRKHLILKLSPIDYILFVVLFSLISYFVFYNGFYARGFYIKQLYFSNSILPNNSNNWAFPIAIIGLGYFFYKVWYSFFPNQRIEKVIDFYRKQIEDGEFPFLLDLIERYHKDDIIKFINKGKDVNIDNSRFRESYDKVPTKEKIKNGFNWLIRKLVPVSWPNRRAYASWVLNDILNNPGFIIYTSKNRPYFYANIIKHFKDRKIEHFPSELVNSFLSALINEKSFWLKKEFVQSENFDFGQPPYFFEENKILGALLKDLSVANVNQVWQPFGDIAIDEIEEERQEGYNSKLFREFREEQFLWEYKTYFGIKFFKIIVVEALVNKYKETHFFFIYYTNITDAILNTFEKYTPKNIEEVRTNYHQLIKIMLENIFLWLRISNKQKDDFLFYNIIPCLGQLVHKICNSDYYGEQHKIFLIEAVLNKYCSLEQNPQTDLFRMELEKILIKPSMLTEDDDHYYTVIKNTWENEFDKVPHYSAQGIDCDYFARLKDKVISKLNLDVEN